MATLLSMCVAVARDVGISVPSTIVGNTEKTAVRLLRQATKAARRIYKDCGWTILQREYTFTVTSGTAEYALPSDFGRFIDETAWDRTQYWQMRGPMSPREWQIVKSGLVQSAGLRKNWRVKRAAVSVANKFVIDPTPANSTDSLVFEYVSNSWATATDGTTLRTDWVADTDIPIIDSDLIELDMAWRMLKRLGLDYAEERAEADDEIARAAARDGGAPILMLARRGFRMPPVNTKETGYGS